MTVQLDRTPEILHIKVEFFLLQTQAHARDRNHARDRHMRMHEASWAQEHLFRPQQAPRALGGVAKLPTSCKRDDLRRIRAAR